MRIIPVTKQGISPANQDPSGAEQFHFNPQEIDAFLVTSCTLYDFACSYK